MRQKFKMLCAIEAGSHFEALQHAVPLGRVHRVLEKLMAECSAKERERLRRKAGLIEIVSREGGIRAAARKLGVDASNLRRNITQ